MPHLRELETGREIVLDDDSQVLVGRGQDADFRIEDRACSRKQFLLEMRAGECFLTPVSPNSPTYCESILICDRVRLDRDVEITCGQSRFTVSFPSPSQPAP